MTNPTQTTKKLTKDQKPWRGAIQMLEQFSKRLGFEIELRNPCAPEYQIARLTCEGVRLIAYPHRTTAGNHHVRIRDEGSKNKKLAQELMEKMYWAKNWVDGKGYQGFEVKKFPLKSYAEVYNDRA